eukprot:scaffold6079_cov66-Attheya_sp.AAC.5
MLLFHHVDIVKNDDVEDMVIDTSIPEQWMITAVIVLRTRIFSQREYGILASSRVYAFGSPFRLIIFGRLGDGPLG